MGQSIDPRFVDNLYTAFREGDANINDKFEEAENVRRVEEIFRLIARKDFAALSEVLAEDVIFEIISSPANPMAGRAQGRQQVIDAARGNFALMEDQRPQIETVVAQGDTVVVVAREQGLFAPTGREYDFHWVQLYTFKEGKLIRVREFLDSSAFMDVA